LRRIAALADIHGNLPALEAVLAEVEREDPSLVVFCGDVALGWLEAETIDRLRGLPFPARFVRGNCDRDMAGEGRPDQDRAGWLSAFEATVEEEVEGLGRVLFCHGTPRSEDEILTEASPAEAFEAALRDVAADLVVGGHTHMQFLRPVGGPVFANAGSVGRPYGEPGAYWLLLGPAVVPRRTFYRLEEAASRLAGTPWAEHAGQLRHPPTRAEAIATFERMAGRQAVQA
jgi:putative phosphoesterase